MCLLYLLMSAEVVAETKAKVVEPETKAKWSSKEPWNETITTSTTALGELING
jgi:hypothetical protein